jgi:hypothetical protein
MSASIEQYRITHVPLWAGVVPFVFTTLALTIPRSRLRSLMLAPLPPLALISIYLLVVPRPAFTGAGDYYGMLANSVICSFMAGVYLIATDLETEYLRQSETVPLAMQKNVSLWSRVKWAIDLALQLRGVGWNWQVKNTPEGKPKGYSRWYVLHIRCG